MKWGWIILILLSLLLVSKCSDQMVQTATASSQKITYMVDAKGNEIAPQAISFETATEGDGLAWLVDSRERRSDLNRVRYEQDETDEEELRENMQKSKNWVVTIDGETYKGYDAVREEEGDFEDWEEAQPSRKLYGYTVRYGYG